MIKIRYIKNSKWFLYIELITVIIGLLIIGFKGFDKGLDFTGGTLFQLKMPTANVKIIRQDLNKLSVKYPAIKDAVLQASPNQVFTIRTGPLTELQKESVIANFKTNFKKVTIERINMVGPSISKSIAHKAIWAVIIGCLAIIGYITLRFEFTFALGAIIALAHDIIVAAAVISLIGWTINTPFIAAILTILGYSINDTIVIFDRIRENRKKFGSTMESEVIIDNSISQVLTRSINSSVTVVLALLAMLILGGLTLHTFLLTMLVGVISGTYSSIFIASPIVFMLDNYKLKRKNNNKNVSKTKKV